MIEALVLKVVTLVGPLFAKKAGELAADMLPATLERARKLWSKLKDRLAGDPVATTDMERFEKDPKRFAAGVEATLAKLLESDPGAQAEVEETIKEVGGPQLNVFLKFGKAEGIVGAHIEEFAGGEAHVTIVADEAKNAHGAVIKKMG